jgi:bifunctional UDP-N-acetylglucosamine pyrophosphorylase/glucosamine-1-phosphate N-acetyltransferase
LDAVNQLKTGTKYVVVGHEADKVQAAFAEQDIVWVTQTEQLGTGHALLQALPELANSDQVLVLLGDTPLINADTLQRLVQATSKNMIGIVTVSVEDPTGFGRIIRNEQGAVCQIVEEKDATADQKAISEINTGIMLLPVKQLQAWLPKLKNTNRQKEYLLTDIMAMAVAEEIEITTVQPGFVEEVLGVNNRAQLALLERTYQDIAAQTLMEKGVTLLDPLRFDLRGELDVGEDVTIDINVIVNGKVKIGNNTYIGPHVILTNVTIGNDVTIHANCVLEDTIIADGCSIGPFARLRPGTHLAKQVKIGNFVETKNAVVGQGSKIPHLSYIGDANIGANVNIGAGVITCNYDGVKKSTTTIHDGAFIGSDSQLIAPVIVGENAYIAAGSTINKDAPAEKLTIARSKQITLDKWLSPKKTRE